MVCEQACCLQETAGSFCGCITWMRRSGRKWHWRVGQGLGHRNSVCRVWDLGSLSRCDGNQGGLRLRRGWYVALQSGINQNTEKQLEESESEVLEVGGGASHVSRRQCFKVHFYWKLEDNENRELPVGVGNTDVSVTLTRVASVTWWEPRAKWKILKKKMGDEKVETRWI